MRMIHIKDNVDIGNVLKEAGKIKRWTPIDFGKYEGLTIPELIFLDASYFYWALTSNLFKNMLQLEAVVVESRLRHIKVPKAVAVPSVFVIRLKNDVFEDFAIVEKSIASRKKSNNVRITSCLDFSLVSRPDHATDRARQVMIDKIKYHFFEKDSDRLKPRDYEQFLGDPDKFSAHCKKRHIREILRWDNPAVITETQNQGPDERTLSPGAIKRIREAVTMKMIRKMTLERKGY